MTQIPLQEVLQHKTVFVVTYYPGYTDGAKYTAEALTTSYSSFYAILGALYYKTFEDADIVAKALNN